jgi:hypothetical protein
MTCRKTSCLMAAIATLALGMTAPALWAADATQASPAKTALTMEDLAKKLADMGYDLKKINDTSYEVVIQRDNWKIYLTILFSADKTRLWLVSNLADIEDISKVPADVLAKLLDGNATCSPSFFYYNTDAKRPAFRYLKIARPVDNRGITASVLRTEIDALFDTIKNTKPVWMPSAWKKAAAMVGPSKVQDNGGNKLTK